MLLDITRERRERESRWWNRWRNNRMEQVEKQVKTAREGAGEAQKLLRMCAACNHPTCSIFNNYRLLTIQQN
jgi:hypothetical protein